MRSLKFPVWDFPGLIGEYVARQIETDSGRLSPLAAILVVAGISLALWVIIALIVTRFF